MCHLKKRENSVLIRFPRMGKEHSVREQGVEDNAWTQGEENKGRMGEKFIMRGSFISTLRVVLLGRSNQEGCDRKDMQHA
jgi:hypothetical protein